MDEEKLKENQKETKKEEKKDTKIKKENKKFSNSKKEETKSKNGIIKLIIAVVVVIAIVIFTYMMLMVDSPKKAVEQMLTEVKEGKVEEAVISEIFQGENINQDTQKSIFNNLSWKIVKEEVKGEEASVEIKITNKDFKVIIDNLKEKIVTAALSGQTIDETKTQEYLLEEINNSEIENVTKTHTIKLKKQDGKWQITEENNIVDILLPGLNNAVETLN